MTKKMKNNQIFIGIKRVKNGFVVMMQRDDDMEERFFDEDEFEKFSQKSLHFTVNQSLDTKIEPS